MQIALILTVVGMVLGAENPCCVFKPDKYTTIDLTPLSGNYFTFPFKIYPGHELTTTFCGNLDTHHQCKNPTTTYGPQPMKDEYSNAACWYVGGLDFCTMDHWDAEKKTFVLTYPGLPDKENQIRVVKFTMHCNFSETHAQVDCTDLRSQGNTLIYICEVYTMHACPKKAPSELRCQICEVLMNLMKNNAQKDEDNYIDTIKNFFCPTLKNPKECIEDTPAEVHDVLKDMEDNIHQFCKDMAYC